jgi:hypothetical protein
LRSESMNDEKVDFLDRKAVGVQRLEFCISRHRVR